MNRITAIRNSLQISQQELAGILGISRSSLSMIEKDRRKLSAEGVVKLGRLEIKHISGNQKKKSEEVINEEAKRSFRIFLEEKKTKCTDQLLKFQEQLDEMISINESAKKRKSILQNESEIYEGVGQYQTQLEQLKMSAEKKIKRYDPAQRLRIQFEIAQLEFQLQHIEEELRRMNWKFFKMWNTSGMTSVKQIQKSIYDLELMILKEGLKMHRTKTRLKKSRKEGGAILKEMGEIEFLMMELQKNLLSIQSEESRSLHEERIADLKLRKMTLEHRKPFYAPSEYDMAEKEIEDCQKLIDVWKGGVLAYQKRIEELQNAEKKSTGGGQSAQ